MREQSNPSSRRSRAPADPIRRSMRRDLAAALDRDYRRELRRERMDADAARFWDRRFA